MRWRCPAQDSPCHRSLRSHPPHSARGSSSDSVRRTTLEGLRHHRTRLWFRRERHAYNRVQNQPRLGPERHQVLYHERRMCRLRGHICHDQPADGPLWATPVLEAHAQHPIKDQREEADQRRGHECDWAGDGTPGRCRFRTSARGSPARYQPVPCSAPRPRPP